MSAPLQVVLLAGGVGGAKMAEGLAALEGVDLSIIGNVADDEEFHGLWVSPDIDTLTYTLSGLINREQGWGVNDEGSRALSMLERLGEDTWMFLGDHDMGLHIHRTRRRHNGERPSQIARDIADALGVKARLVLPTDDPLQTRVCGPDGWLSFQEYFVRARTDVEVSALSYEGAEEARPTPEALGAIARADLLVLAPSNPLVSIAPILAVPGIREAVEQSKALRVGVSPLIGGKVVKGPADRMMASLGMRADALGVAQQYAGLLDALVIDSQDTALIPEIEALPMAAPHTDIMMRNLQDKTRLARFLLNLLSKGEQP